MAKTTDLAPVEINASGVVVASAGATSEQIRYALANDLKLWVASEGGTEEDFLLRTLDATGGEDEILGGTGLTKAEDLLGIPFKITGYSGMHNSDYEESRLGVYVVVTVADRDGVTYTTALGSNDAIVKVVKLAEAGAIPQKGWSMLEKSAKPTARGFHPVNLVRADDPTTF
jgi:hypothetical protein